MGDRIDRRHGSGRQNFGYKELLPRAAHARKPRPRSRTQPHRAVVDAPSLKLQKVLRKGIYLNFRHSVRERRSDEAGDGRRLLHSLLRKLHARRQGHAVLRRPRKSGKVPFIRPQRRRGRAVKGQGHGQAPPGFAPLHARARRRGARL